MILFAEHKLFSLFLLQIKILCQILLPCSWQQSLSLIGVLTRNTIRKWLLIIPKPGINHINPSYFTCSKKSIQILQCQISHIYRYGWIYLAFECLAFKYIIDPSVAVFHVYKVQSLRRLILSWKNEINVWIFVTLVRNGGLTWLKLTALSDDHSTLSEKKEI